MTTKADIKRMFNHDSRIEQHDSKQLFTVYEKAGIYLLSYTTIIGFKDSLANVWYVTKQKYSSTTSRHISSHRKSTNCLIEYLEPKVFDKMLKEYVDLNYNR